MAIIDLGIVKTIFGGSAPSPEQHRDLVKEVLLMTLARAASADSNTNPVEVATVQRVLKNATGDEISLADIRVAAASEIFERAPLEKYLSSVAGSLTASDRVMVAQSLAEVIRSDVKVGEEETAFFNTVVAALDISAAELAGLVS
ncbi:MAG: TerB family tellurite resistance protein [Gammaproteobacteria bacterium]|nr:TerB family tellurite resistance protein [Gammaproteobacteria bacterium]MDH3507663.1 TerB family tellurite resistance protein [Gammaproteobacteria bacterium]